MKKITRTEILNKTFMITDDGQELLIHASRRSKTKTNYCILEKTEKAKKIAELKELDKILRLELKKEVPTNNPNSINKEKPKN